MALEFVIIPSNKVYEDYADDVEAMMRHNIKHSMLIKFDKDYDKKLNTRIAKWKKDEYDIITIDEDYADNNCIVVRFSENCSTPERMSLLDFIDLVSSFEHESEGEIADEKKSTDTVDDETLKCIIM